MKRVQKQWLEAVPWQSVLSINQALCQAQQTEHKANSKTFAAAQKKWEAAISKSMALPEVLEICKECCNLSPFAFNNGNTFTAIAKTLIEDWLKLLPPVEAQIIRTTVAHYVAELVGRRELLGVLDHFEPLLKQAPPAKAAVPASSSGSAAPTKAAPVPTPPISSAQPTHG